MRRAPFLVFLLIAFASASISSMGMDGAIDQSGSADIIIIADFEGSAGSSVFLNLSGDIQDVMVKDRSGLIIKHELVPSGDNTLIYAVVPADRLSYEIHSDSFTKKDGPDWSFDMGIGASENISNFSAILALPGGSVLSSTNGAVQGGDPLKVLWDTSQIDTGHRARLKAGYSLSASMGDDGPITVAVAILAILLVGYAVWTFRHMAISKTKGPSDRETPPAAPATAMTQTTAPNPPLESNAVFKTLDETDKEIIREISRQGGKTTQAHLYLNTHIPKATLSRRLVSLEGRGILQRSQKGNRNLVSLGDPIRS
ncbi:MAG: hypothetical protein V1827_00845 [Candidatus Micrarchaeota archaeon]